MIIHVKLKLYSVIGIPKVLQFIKKDTGIEYTFRYTL